MMLKKWLSPVTTPALDVLLAGTLAGHVALVVGGAPFITVAVVAALRREAEVVRTAPVAMVTTNNK